MEHHHFIMKRLVLIIAIVVAGSYLKAQTTLPVSFTGYHNPYLFSGRTFDTSSVSEKKWFVSRYTAVNAGYSFFRGGGFSYISAPVGLQLNRKLNNNLYAFAGVSVNPTYINFNQPIPLSGMNKGLYGSSMYRPNNFGVYPRAELGLMYVNDEKTFSVSGSISVQRGGYTVFPVQQYNTQRNNGALHPAN